MPWTKGSSHCSTQCVHPGAATGSGRTWEGGQTHETPHDRDREQVGYTLGSRTVYAILLEGGVVGSSERGGNEDPVEGREGGKIPWKDEKEGAPVPEDQYQERFWRRRLDGIGLDTINKELLAIVTPSQRGEGIQGKGSGTCQVGHVGLKGKRRVYVDPS